jgi:hypothetical protein
MATVSFLPGTPTALEEAPQDPLAGCGPYLDTYHITSHRITTTHGKPHSCSVGV